RDHHGHSGGPHGAFHSARGLVKQRNDPGPISPFASLPATVQGRGSMEFLPGQAHSRRQPRTNGRSGSGNRRGTGRGPGEDTGTPSEAPQASREANGETSGRFPERSFQGGGASRANHSAED